MAIPNGIAQQIAYNIMKKTGIDYTDQYNTPLTEKEQPQFDKWADKMQEVTGRDVRKDTRDYDIQGFWKYGDRKVDERGHMSDLGKKPNHPTFSNESIHSTQDQPGGKWIENKDGTFYYQPSQEMLDRTHDVNNLQQYIQKREPGTGLMLPDGTILIQAGEQK
jgi:hypothetical protein